MSFCADDRAGYFETVQMYFIELTHQSLFLSGRDLELLEAWRDRGANATAVCKGLRDAVEALPDDDPPRDIHACRRWIEPYVEQVEQRAVGGHDPGSDAAAPAEPETSTSGPEAAGSGADAPDDSVLERALDRIERAGRRADDEEVREVYRRAWRAIRDLFGTDDIGEQFEQLAAIEESLVDGYYRALDRTERRTIEERITEGDEELLDDMSPEAKRQHLRARRRRILMEQFDLVSLID